MTLLSKSAILCANDLQTEDVDVPEWGGSVRVRSFTGRERDAFEASMVRGEGKDRKVDLTNMRARLVGLTVIDEGGQRLFTDEEVDLLGAKSGAALDRVFAGLVAQGVAIWMGFQAFINMGENLGALPTKGLTLPLMSFGGSAILINLVALAIVLRVDHENRRMMQGGRS